MVLRAKEPKRSAISSCAGPKTRRKSLARNLPNLLAAIAVIVFTDSLQDGEMVSFCKETGRRKTPSLLNKCDGGLGFFSHGRGDRPQKKARQASFASRP